MSNIINQKYIAEELDKYDETRYTLRDELRDLCENCGTGLKKRCEHYEIWGNNQTVEELYCPKCDD